MGNETHAICGAKTRSGAPCKSKPMKNGRCRMHGGKATGPKTPEGKAKAALNSRKHGAYIEKLLNDQEKELYDFLHNDSIQKYKLDQENPMHMAALHRACVTYIKLVRLDQWELEREFEPHFDDSGATDEEGRPLLKGKPKYNEKGEIIEEEIGKVRDLRWSKNAPAWETHFQNYIKLLGVDRATEIKNDHIQGAAQTVVDGFAWLWGQKSKDEE